MFTNKSFSNVGRKTAQSIDTLKKRLGVDAEATTKPTVATRALSSSVLDSSLPTGSTTSTQDLVQRFSRRKVKSETKQGKVEDFAEAVPPSPSHVRQVAPLRYTSAFRSLGREELDKRMKSDEVPPVGSYSPKDDCTAALSRVKHPPPHGCSFASREITRSRRVVLAEQLRAQGQPYEHLLDNPGRELPEGLPENPLARKKQIVFVNMSKQLPRPDLMESANIVYHAAMLPNVPATAVREDTGSPRIAMPREFRWFNLTCPAETLSRADLREENSFSRSGLATHAFSRLEPREPGPSAKVLQPVYFKFREHHGHSTSNGADGAGVGSVVRDSEKQHNQFKPFGMQQCCILFPHAGTVRGSLLRKKGGPRRLDGWAAATGWAPTSSMGSLHVSCVRSWVGWVGRGDGWAPIGRPSSMGPLHVSFGAPFVFPFWAPVSRRGWAPNWAPFISGLPSCFLFGLPSCFLSGLLGRDGAELPLGSLDQWLPPCFFLGSLHVSFLGCWVGWIGRPRRRVELPLGSLHQWAPFMFPFWALFMFPGLPSCFLFGASLHVSFLGSWVDGWAAATGWAHWAQGAKAILDTAFFLSKKERSLVVRMSSPPIFLLHKIFV
ncbi:unnamed protein product [Symbiodinium sp. CCMP2456]|nr:unnamed protein product [Symbiodinium sp. CCMP2456]